jgi:nucleoside-diphosphate-sugar epimerase
VIVRPATVCGYSPRLRLDLTVNILTNHAVNFGKITVFGGEQKRPNIHIEDITDLYVDLLSRPKNLVAAKVWNAGYENHRVREIAEIIRQTVDNESVEIVTTPTDDHRSYHISSDKIKRDLGFVPQHTIEDAVQDLVSAFHQGKIPNSMDNIKYYNVRQMNAISMK